MTRLVVSLGFIVVAVLAALGGVLAAGYSPLLGLDLQGGASVVLEPDPDAEFDSATLDTAVAIIRNRVDGLGVAEPEIARQGDTILVQLPGVDDQQRALELIGQTAQLQFRPVLETISPPELFDGELTDPEQVVADEEAVLAEADEDGTVIAIHRLGPTAVEGEALESATARTDGVEWTVGVVFKSGDEAIGAFNDVAGACFAFDPARCPGGRVATVLDGVVTSALGIQGGNQVFQPFQRDQITISGSFDESEARDTALVLRYGSLPVQLERQTAQTVSATLGHDALDAGITAGIVGLMIVALFMVAYYRLLGVVAMLSLALSGGLLWTIIAWLGETQGLALTLAGVTGIIVSIGVAVDSNVVFYEHLREDVRKGRTLRSAVEGSFTAAFRTIVKADVASLIGAGLLYWLTVGPVRGFALYLGLSTMLDLVASYFFMRPAVVLLARSKRLQRSSRAMGVPALAVETSPA